MQTSAQPEAALTFTIPSLNEGEHYAGIVLDPESSQPTHHLILLPGEAKSITWPDALTWAEQAGGALPTRQEQALLYANLKPHFKGDWHWSGEQHAGHEAFAWCQYFGDGYQGSGHKDDELRARAVRRLPI